VSERRPRDAVEILSMVALGLLLVLVVLGTVIANRGAIADYLCEQGRTERCESP
jgi:hypothetical protein